MFFISYAKNFFIPPSQYGIGSPTRLRSLTEALDIAPGGRHVVAFVNNGFPNGNISAAIDQLSTTVRAAGKDVRIVERETDLTTVCRSSLRGVTECYGAVNFHSAPGEGGENWNYTLMADGALGERIFVNRNTNDAEVFVLPLQHAVDSVIANVSGYRQLPDNVLQYPFTSLNQEEREARITRLYQGTLMDIIAVAFFIGICGICYHLVGSMALEREQGMSQLIQAMMPNKRRWEPQAARLAAAHLAFDIVYLPGWIIMGAIVAGLVFPDASIGLIIGLHILIGLSLCSYSLFCGSFFRKAQLSGISSVLIAIVLAIISQLAFGADGNTGTVFILSLLFPPMTYVFFIIYLAGFQQHSHPTRLGEASPASSWKVPGGVFLGLMAIQFFIFPILAALVERSLYGTASKTRKVTHGGEAPAAVRLQNFCKTYKKPWTLRTLLAFVKREKRNDGEVVAVKDLSLDIRRGQIMVLLGANGSGKSTTLNAISGLDTITGGSIEIDGTGGLGLCPQRNVLWDLLTVKEHVEIFNRLKTTDEKATEQETAELIAACDMDRKLNAKAGTLSGGQKRKLQLAMMFTGGSRVCCVDEVSSGIDPLARRKIWDILLAERGRRTVLLTTHFLDEADVLSDQIALLSKGVLKADGTSVELKHKLGDGYRVFVGDRSGYTPNAGSAEISHHHDYDQTVYTLKTSSETSRFISELENHGISDYRVQGPTIEDIFLKLATEATEDEEVPLLRDTSSTASGDELAGNSKEEPVKLVTGQGTTLVQQSWILFRKRFTVLKSNRLPYIAALLIPVIAAGMTTLFLKDYRPLSCRAEDTINRQDVDSFSTFSSPEVPLGPSGSVPSETQLSAAIPYLNSTSLHIVNTSIAFESYIVNRYHNVTPGGFFLGNTPEFSYIAEFTVAPAVIIQNLLDNLLADSFSQGLSGIITTQYQAFALPLGQGTGDSLQLVLYSGLALSIAPGFFALYPTAERLSKVRALHYSNGIRSAPLWIAYTAFDFLFGLLISVVVIIVWTAIFSLWYAPGYLFVVLFLYFLTSTVMSYIFSLWVPSQLAAFATSAGYQCSMFLLYFISILAIITYAPVNLIDHYVTVAHFAICVITPSGNMLRALLLSLNQFSLLCRGDQIASYPGDITVMGGPILYLLVQFFICLAFLIWYDAGGRPAIPFRRQPTPLSSHESALKDVESASGRPVTPEKDPDVDNELSRVRTGNDGLRVLHISKQFGSNLAVDNVTFGIRKGETFALLGPNGAGKSTTISLVRGDLRPTRTEQPGEVYVENVALSQRRAAARNHLGVCPQFDAIDSMTAAEHLRFYARARGVPDVEHNVSAVMHAVGITQYADRKAQALSGGNKRKLSLAISMMGNPAVLLLDEPSSGMDALAKRVMWRTLAQVAADRALLITTHSMEEADALATRAGILARRMLALGTTDTLRRKHGDAWHIHLVHKQAPHTTREEMERVKQWVKDNIPGAQTEERTYHGQLRFSVPNSQLTALISRPSTPTTGPTALASSSSSSPLTSDPSNLTNSTEKSDDFQIDTTAPHEPQKPIQNQHQQSTNKQGAGILFSLLERNRDTLAFAYYSVSPTTLDQVFLNVVNRHNVEEENYERDSEGAGASGGIGKAGTGVWKRLIGRRKQ